MTWSFRLLTVAGTEVRVHLTFFLLLAWFGAVQWMAAGPEAAAFAVVFIVLLFLCVLLHEFGHVFAARRYGIRTPDITLLPIGGLASLERMPEKPSQEIFVALAGPAVNVIIAFILVAFAGARLDPRALDLMENPASDMLSRLAIANVALVVFNLIPAFPMDGGRVLRALLAMRMGFVRATRTAAFVGQSLAFFLGFIGLLGNPLLILIAVFVYLAATAESQYVEMRSLARGYLARDAMITKFEHLTPTSTADDAVALLLRTTQQEFPVLDQFSRLQGLVTRDVLIEVLRDRGGSTPVVEFMHTDVPVVAGTATLDNVIQMLQQKRARAVAVADTDNRLLGFITPENFAEMMMVGQARGA
ncbi:MAG: site-2 protease family protein [Pseudomonadota bacterium]|jgi:stage IV sporulation protein FB